jgi:hypothetical protein
MQPRAHRVAETFYSSQGKQRIIHLLADREFVGKD